MAATGRHRRYQPSRINRASLTVTASGAGIALPLIGAGTVSAAPVDTWEKVAACESTSNWQINTSNGYFGGLQFSQSTWEAFGGGQYAARADLATKDQQIAIAEKVLKGQGPQAWPHCSVKAGLTRGGDAPDVSPGNAASARKASDTTKSAPRSDPKKAASPTSVPTEREGYTVAGGDSLSGIAASEEIRGGWQRLYEENRRVIGSDPDLIFPGQKLVLRVPSPAKDKPAAEAPAPPKKEEAKKPAAKAQPSKQAEKPKAAGAEAEGTAQAAGLEAEDGREAEAVVRLQRPGQRGHRHPVPQGRLLGERLPHRRRLPRSHRHVGEGRGGRHGRVGGLGGFVRLPGRHPARGRQVQPVRPPVGAQRA